MRLQTALQQGLELLRDGAIDTPGLTAEVLLGHALRRERVFLLAHPEYELAEVEWLHYGRYLYERLQGKPTQYITRRQEFYGRDFHVESGVLIPRPETEHLVEAALELLRARRGALAERRSPGRPCVPELPAWRPALPAGGGLPSVSHRGHTGLSPSDLKRAESSSGPTSGAAAATSGRATPRVLDIGAGSGAVAITLALESGARLWSSDVSSDALRIARRNAVGLDARCQFVQCDLGAAFAAGSFDLVVSNPPYVESADLESLQREVREWEPRLALDGGVDGLAIYRRLIPEAARLLRPGGWLAVEIGWQQGETVPALFDTGWREIRVRPDLAGHPRVITAQRAV